MCGIIGVTGAVDPLALLLEGLERLEYRGYDSAGVVLVDPETKTLWRRRAADQGRAVATLSKLAEGAPRAARSGLGHTRWATHGAPTEENAHPHLDCSGRVALVHNGIIENHRALAALLDARGHSRRSATDTEVLVHLVEEELSRGADLAEALRRSLAEVRGDFAVALVDAADPERIVAARRTSPLVYGRAEGVGVVGSDIASLLAVTRELYQLGDDEVVEVTPGRLAVWDREGRPVDPVALVVDWDVDAARKGGFPDFMSKEIREQPVAVAETLLGRVRPDGSTVLEELELPPGTFESAERVVLVACGSSFHASLVGRQVVEGWARLPAEAEIASEMRYRDAVLGGRTLVVAVSQSGETVDTLHALRAARAQGAPTVAMTNVVDSLMAREADAVLYTRAGPEIGVASTKSHLTQLALVEVLALHLAQRRRAAPLERLAGLARRLAEVPRDVERAVGHAEDYLALAERFAEVEDFFFLGRGIGLPVAMEGALKLKELAYVRAEAYPAGEMKHGPISLIEPGAVVVALATGGRLREKVLGNVAEVKARGATVLAVCDEGDEEAAALADAVLEVPAVPETLSPLVAVVPLQFLAYGVAAARGNDVDRPRNLAKVVTVE
jgi:glucosamine--fructose-6-phosphate aminotransferase (isomerizing)